MREEVTVVTDGNFDREVLKSRLPVMIDFWAEWCTPCKIIAPIMDELARDYRARLNVCKVNVDDNPGVATELGVMSIPTVIFFKKGEEQKRVVGANPRTSYENVIKKLVGG